MTRGHVWLDWIGVELPRQDAGAVCTDDRDAFCVMHCYWFISDLFNMQNLHVRLLNRDCHAMERPLKCFY